MYVGSRADVGAVALCPVANWFINGETVLVDGGVRFPLSPVFVLLTRSPQTALIHPTSW